MGKFTDRFIRKVQVPAVPPIPERDPSVQTGTYINEQNREIIIRIVDHGKPEDLATGLGAIEIGKDIVKQTISSWHQREAMTRGILVPKGNGHG